ncbi:MAG: pectate lyase family protein [Thermoguttaceae bacterium]
MRCLRACLAAVCPLRGVSQTLGAAILLAVPVLLWFLAALFRFRVTDIFHARLMKFPGPAVVCGAMALCPLAAMLLGLRMARKRHAVVLGRVTAVSGGLLVLAFVVLIGIPMLHGALEPKTPKNPSTPRPVPEQLGLPVFPGAEGFGTRSPAGRGGQVIEVTCLADDGPGTLREALNHAGPRIIVFRVGGTIELKGHLFISQPFVTVAGQTAPGQGICIKNAGIVITTHDVLIQHLRIRPGNEGRIDADNNDAVAILGRHGRTDGAYNVVLDHVSASWAEDETISTWYGAHDITISWSILSEALHRSRHRKRTHSAGLLVGDSSYRVSMHHNLLAHNDFRNPLICDGGTHDFVNNVVYNWGALAAEIVDRDSNSFVNFVGNYFKPGPSSRPGVAEILVNPAKGTPRLFVEGNLGPRRPDPSMEEWALVGYGWDPGHAVPASCRSHRRFQTWPISTCPAADAVELVLAHAGATAPKRDAVDQRIVADVRNASGAIIDSPQDVGGYPTLAGGATPDDSDDDGMPDQWERANALDPLDPSDASGDRDGDGYTNIEEYLHCLSR